MRYVVYGAGSVGGVVGAHLAMSGRPVTLIARPPHVEAIGERGVELTGLLERSNIPVHAVSGLDAVVPTDDTVLLLTMKSADTGPALAALPGAFDRVPTVCCQNGVRNEELASAHGLQTYGAVVVVGASVESPGRFVYSAPGHVWIGRFPGGTDEVCDIVAQDIAASGLNGETVADVMAHKWSKLLRNLTNAYMALVGASIQETMEVEEHRLFMADLIDEALVVLRAARIAYEPDGGSFDWWIAHKAGGTAERGDGTIEAEIADLRRAGARRGSASRVSYASTYQDLAARRTRVEVEFFNGEIVRLAGRSGIDVPMNALVLERCERAAVRRSGPGTETTSSLRSALPKRHVPTAIGS